MPSDITYDLVVIGGGSGGLECGWQAVNTYHAKNVALIDIAQYHGPPHYCALGGTCVNVGCIPKKFFHVGSRMYEYILESQGFGYKIPPGVEKSWDALVKAKNKYVQKLNVTYQKMFMNGLVFFCGFGRVTSKNVVEVINEDEGKVIRTLNTKNIVIATGSWPWRPDIPGIEHTITSNEAFYLESLPKRILIVGGGFIAVEFACIFNAYKPEDGEVELCYRRELFLRGFDVVVRQELATQLDASGINLQFQDTPAKVEKGKNDVKTVFFVSGKRDEYDLIMYATGRKPRTEGLGLEKLGVEFLSMGGVKVDKYSRTNIKGIYAIGDVTNRVALTPIAIREGLCLAETIFTRKPRAMVYENIPLAVFAIPAAAGCGLTEAEAIIKYPNVNIYQKEFLPLMHNVTGDKYKKNVYKIIANSDANDKILGVHLIGRHTTEVIQIVAVAMNLGVTVRDFRNTISVHPTSSEELTSIENTVRQYRNYHLITGSKM